MSARYSILTTATKRLPFETYPAMDSLYSPCFTSSLSVSGRQSATYTFCIDQHFLSFFTRSLPACAEYTDCTFVTSIPVRKKQSTPFYHISFRGSRLGILSGGQRMESVYALIFEPLSSIAYVHIIEL